MAELVAIDLPGGQAFVDEVRRAWDDGDAILPVDRRLPPPARARLLDQLVPRWIVDGDGRRASGCDAVPIEPGDAAVVPTSGTGGDPKGVVLTHDAVAAHAVAVHRHLGVTATDRWLACLPLAHVGGLGVILRALVDGIGLDVLDRFDAAQVDAAPTRLGSTLVSLVPTALGRVEPAAWRWIVLGGSADPGPRPANVVRTYGLTETGGGVVYDGTPLPGTEVRIVDGEIELRGPSLLRAYRDGSDPRRPDGWLPTGDLGAIDAAGHLVVHGRAGDLIVTGGENVWPDPVEAVLRAHPAVAEVAVVGAADPEWGSAVVAHVVPSDASAPPTLDDLRDLVKATLPAYAAPRRLVLADALPRTALGKVRRRALTTAPDGGPP
jgi:o-succinylbenzoate---CoA ligase